MFADNIQYIELNAGRHMGMLLSKTSMHLSCIFLVVAVLQLCCPVAMLRNSLSIARHLLVSGQPGHQSVTVLLAAQSWLGHQQQQMRASSNIARALMPRTASLEQAGGLHRMVLRGHTGPIGKVLLTPGGTDVVTGILLLHTSAACSTTATESEPRRQFEQFMHMQTASLLFWS